MGSRRSGDRFHRSRRAGFDLIGYIEFGDGANCST